MNQGHGKAGFNAQVDDEGDWSLDHPLVLFFVGRGSIFEY